MKQETNGRPYPDDVWGLEILDPPAQYKWVKKRWQSMLRDETRRPVLLSFVPSAERTALRCLETFARFGRENNYGVVYLSPGESPLLTQFAGETKVIYLIHRANRFLGVREWLMLRDKWGGDSLCVFTAERHEVDRMPAREQFILERAPAVNAGCATIRAQKILADFVGESPKRDSEFKSFFDLLIEIGVADVPVAIGLLQRGLGCTSDFLMHSLARPEISDLVRISGRGAFSERCLSFRGAWLAKSVGARARAKGYPMIKKLLKCVDPKRVQDSFFFLNFLIAVRAQGDEATWEQLARTWQKKIASCRTATTYSVNLAWSLFLHDGLLDQIRLYCYLLGRKFSQTLLKRNSLF